MKVSPTNPAHSFSDKIKFKVGKKVKKKEVNVHTVNDTRGSAAVELLMQMEKMLTLRCFWKMLTFQSKIMIKFLN